MTAFPPLAGQGGPKGNPVRHDLHKPEPRAPIPPSPLVGEGAPEGRMRGARPKACGFPPHPAFGHLLPQGEKGAIPRFRSSSNPVPNSIAFGPLLPRGEKGRRRSGFSEVIRSASPHGCGGSLIRRVRSMIRRGPLKRVAGAEHRLVPRRLGGGFQGRSRLGCEIFGQNRRVINDAHRDHDHSHPDGEIRDLTHTGSPPVPSRPDPFRRSPGGPEPLVSLRKATGIRAVATPSTSNLH